MPEVTLAWGSLPDTDELDDHLDNHLVDDQVAPSNVDLGQPYVTVDTTEDLDRILHAIHLEAAQRDLPQQVDIWAGSWPPPHDQAQEPPDPMLQVLVGHPDRGSVLWLGPTDCWVAVEPTLPPPAQPLLYDRGGQGDELPPDYARLQPATVTDVLHTFLTNGQRSDRVTWIAI